MALDVSTLGSHILSNGQQYAFKAIADSPTAKSLISSKNVVFGIKTSTKIPKINSAVTFVNGASCGRAGGSTTALGEATLSAALIKDEHDICVAQLHDTIFAEAIAKGQTPEESMLPVLADAIMNDRAGKVAYGIEQLIWRGDTSLTGTTNLKYINGIDKQVTATTSTATGSTMDAKLKNFYLANNVDVRSSEDFTVFVGKDIFDEYVSAIADKNLYKPTSDSTLFGTTAKLQVATGLNGTRKVFGLRLSDVRLGMDGQNDSDSATLRYSIETDKWYQDFRFVVGVAVVWPEQTLKATLA